MKKSKLISLLNNLEGDPDIVLWNGLVGDWMDISPNLVESDLVRMTFDYYCKSVEFETQRDRNDWDYKLSQSEIDDLRKYFKKINKWECNEFVDLEDIKEKRYKSKRVVFIDAKCKGETYGDRLGKIRY